MTWAALGISAWLVFGPFYLQVLRPSPNRVTDYFQDWSSARNVVTGRRVYSEHATSLPLYLGQTVVNPDPRIARNAHPPTSVLLALPLARVPYPDAVLAWNLVSLTAFALSLVIVCCALRPSSTVAVAILALLPFCHPLLAHFYHCQLTLILVLLVTSIWSLDRSDHPIGAGVLLGTAAAIKLFPAYLAVYYLARRQYRVVLTALLTFLGWSGLTVVVLGLQTYDDYIHRVVPGLGLFQGYSFNLSLAGLWHKLFNPVGDGGPVQPLWAAPGLARGGTLLSDLIITMLVVFLAWRARQPAQQDLAFGVAVTAMLLTTPVAWDISLPLLLVPIMLLVVGANGGRSLTTSLFLGAVLVIFWLPQHLLIDLVGRPKLAASPVFMLGMPSAKFYGIIGLLGLLLHQSRRVSDVRPSA